MDFKGLQNIRVESISDWVTNADLKSLAEDYALEVRGNRIGKAGMLFEGDYGTQHRFYSYPLRPNAVVLINDATDNGSGLIRISTASVHGYVTSDRVFINDVLGVTSANGVWVVTRITNSTFDLQGSTFSGTYTTGTGITTKTPITIIRGSTIIDASTGYEHEIIVGVDSNNLTRIFVDTSSTQIGTWVELTETMTGTINDASIGASDTSIIISSTLTENGNSLDITDSVRFPNDYFKGWMVYNATAGNYAYVTAFTAGATPTLSFGSTIIGANGLVWATTNNLALYRNSEVYIAGFNAVAGFFTYSNTATPHVRISPRGSKRKATIFYGDPSSKTYRNPVQAIRRSTAQNVFSNSFTLAAGWYLRNAQLPQSCALTGSTGAPVTPAGTSPGAEYIYDGIAVEYTLSNTFYVTGNTPFTRYAFTLQFGEQESDPIWMFYYASTVPYNDYFCDVAFQVFMDIGKIPKGLTGINIYSWVKEWRVDSVTVTTNGPYTADDFSEYQLLGTLDINTGWASGGFTFEKRAVDSVTTYWAKSTTITLTYAGLLALNFGNGNGSLLNRLGHTPDLNRSYMTPRFGAFSKESRGAFTVVDEDDNTIRRSSYSGLGTNMDDGFADVTVDEQGDKQQWDLTSTGELLGIAVVDDIIVCFKRYEIEMIDAQSGITRRIVADVLSKDSITETPYGIVWCGNNGIWILKNGSLQPELLNEPWLNRFDGSEFCTGTTSYITESYRTSAVGGYNYFYDEVIFFIKTNNTSEKKYVYRYSFKKQRWIVRTFELGSAMGTNVDIKYFWRRNDGTLTIGTGNGLFKYPITTVYTDGSRINQAGTTLGGNGFERYLKFNFGSIYDLLKGSFFKIFVIDKAMSSISGSGAFTIKFFANYISTAFDSKTALMDSATPPRPLAPRGAVESLQVEISNSGAEADTKQFDITAFFAGLQQFTRIGNR